MRVCEREREEEVVEQSDFERERERERVIWEVPSILLYKTRLRV